MPLNHTVFWKLKPNISDGQISFLENALRTLEKIEGVISVNFGKNITNRAPYNYVMCVSENDSIFLLKQKYR